MRALMRVVVGFRGPRRSILGLVMAGEVEEAGKRAARFHVGDRVCAFTGLRFGGYAQYGSVSEAGILARAPSNLTDEETAAIPYGGLLALHFLRKGGASAGRSVLVYGASGAIGTAALQLAKHLGAEVTAVCGPTNIDLVKSLGADNVLDYTNDAVPPGRYALVFDAVGRRKTSPLKTACQHALAPGGRFLSVDNGRPRFGREDLALLTDLAEAGAIKPVIDRSYPLDQVADAHRYVEEGHKRGNVVITVAH
jgi:NADPH:quinone reductase-like Zn-dependent oxidoreductase